MRLPRERLLKAVCCVIWKQGEFGNVVHVVAVGCAYVIIEEASQFDGAIAPITPQPQKSYGEVRVKIRFYRDPDSGEPHIYNHGITEDEVRDVLSRPGEDRPGADDSRMALGQTRAGRCLRVVYVADPEADGVFVVTAYELRGSQLKAYRRRRRRRGK